MNAAQSPATPARRLLRVAAWAVAALAIVAVVLVLAARFLLFPALSQRADAFADALSRALGQRVEVGAVSGRWAGTRIQVDLRDVRLHAADGATPVDLPDVQTILAWRSLLLGRPALNAVTLKRPALVARRDAQGRVYFAGHVLPALRDGDRGPGVGEALGALDALNVSDGTLTWVDELRGAPPLVFTAVDIAIARSSDALSVTASASPPRELATAITLQATVRLPDRAIATATGTVSPALQGADVAAWKPWLDLPLEITQARGDLRLDVSLASGRLVDGNLQANVTGVAARLAPDLPPLLLRSLSGRVAFGPADVSGVRRLSGQDITLAPAAPGEAPVMGPLAFDVNLPLDAPGETRFTVAAVDLAAADDIVAALPLPAEARRLLAEARPRGRVSSGEVRVSGRLTAPERYAVDASVADLAVRRTGRLPGLAGITGTLTLRPEGGTAKLASARMENVAIPGLAEPLTIESLSGAATWTLGASGTQVTFDRLAIASRDFAAVVAGNAAADAAGDWRADLNVEVERLDGTRLVRYLPGLGGDAASWMRTALLRAPFAAGRVRFQGRAADFPFARPGTGVFEASARVAGGRLAYAPGWPVLENLDATLTLAGGNLRADITRATLAGLDATGGRVDVANLLGTGATSLAVDAGLRGPLAGVLRFVQDSPLRKATGDALDGWSAEGPAQVAVKLAMPLAAPAKAQSTVTIDLQGNRLASGRSGLEPITDLRGQLRVDGAAFAATGLQGRAFGGPFEGSLRRGADGKLDVQAAGSADFAAVARALGMPASMAPSGIGAYRLAATAGATLQSLTFESDLKDVALAWPAPLGKSAGVAWPTRIVLANDVVDAAIGPAIGAKLRVRRAGGRTTVERGAISIGAGAATLPAQPGLRVALHAESVDADRLLEWSRHGGSAAGAPGGVMPPLAEARIVTPLLTLAERRFHDVDVNVRPDGAERWQAQVQSREIAGRVIYASGGRGTVTARLQRLDVPSPAPGAGSRTGEPIVLPAMDLQSDRFSMLGRNYGRLALTATNAGTQWRLQRLTLTLPHCRLNASGTSDPRTVAAPARSSVTFEAAIDDIGLCLGELGRPAEVAGGTGRITGSLAWRAPIIDFDVDTLSGEIKVQANNGRFLQVRQGMAGTLLSVLSLRMLGDMATLNFRSAFSEGFRFTEVQGTATIADGVLSTTDFGMQGPAATVAIRGTADLRRETQELDVRVAPALSNALTAGLTIVNPLLGAGTFLANRLFRPEGMSLVTFDYRITGTFAAPVVREGRR